MLPLQEFRLYPTVRAREKSDRWRVKPILIPVLLLTFLGRFMAAQPGTHPAGLKAAAVRIPVRADSRLWLEGSSNVRDWTCRATSIDATIEVDDVQTAEKNRSVKAVAVKVPVRMLKCGDRHMEAHVYSALKAPPAPATNYITAKFDSLAQAGLAGEPLETTGQVTVAGVERTVRMTVRSERLPDGSYRARGSVPIKMTDFGIKPPRPWGGILRTADKVVIQFEIFIAPVT